MNGSCYLGDECGYAHGEAELRPLAPEGQQILERKARLAQEAMHSAHPAMPPTTDADHRGQGFLLCLLPLAFLSYAAY